jgi:carboxyl-terminal processing protease
VAGMFLGYKLTQNTGRGLFGTNKQSTLQEALELIQYRYVDPVNPDTLQEKAIMEMMEGLDPHSVYLPPIDLKEANEELAGNFEGIGVEFNVFEDSVTVTYVIPEGPSDKAGILAGDKIIKAGDSSLLQKGISTEKIKSLIKGPRKSTVQLTLVRNGKSLTKNVTRGLIPTPSLEAAYLLDVQTGYMKLSRFAETTYEEFMESLEALQGSGMTKLILDLRGNGGGLLNEAVQIADEFLAGDKLIVYTEGLHSKRKEFRCERPGLFEKGELVLLVDEFSASASEVLSGAIQDWCRGTVIGRTTFGKGLVQEQYILQDGAAIRLTIARYFTPLGRSIQRPYEKGKKVYMDEPWDRYHSDSIPKNDLATKKLKEKKYFTTCGDTLYAGGGITPKIQIVPEKEVVMPHANLLLASVGEFNNFAFQFYRHNESVIKKMKSANNLLNDGKLKKQLWDGWIKHTQKDSLNYQIATAAEKELVLERLLATVARYQWRNEGFYQVVNANDPYLRKALEVVKK